MPKPDAPFDVDQVAKLINVHGYATVRDKQREIIDTTVDEYQAEWLAEQQDQARSDADSASIEARRDAPQGMSLRPTIRRPHQPATKRCYARQSVSSRVSPVRQARPTGRMSRAVSARSHRSLPRSKGQGHHSHGIDEESPRRLLSASDPVSTLHSYSMFEAPHINSSVKGVNFLNNAFLGIIRKVPVPLGRNRTKRPVLEHRTVAFYGSRKPCRTTILPVKSAPLLTALLPLRWSDE